MKNLLRYIIPAFLSQERLTFLDQDQYIQGWQVQNILRLQFKWKSSLLFHIEN